MTPSASTPRDFLPDLQWRNLLHQTTGEDALRKHLNTGMRRAYVGFDPTADSLTIGNMIPIMLLKHAQLAGHAPVVVMGGGTGLIGDPSGKSAERQLLTPERVEQNVASQRRIFEKFLDFSEATANRATIVNNADWLLRLTYLEALRDIGKHFSVNMMIQKESVKERLHARDQGISYTEFSYMILQAYDFFVLARDWQKAGLSGPVTIQMGGSDQWGNIVAGTDLIRKMVWNDVGQIKGEFIARTSDSQEEMAKDFHAELERRSSAYGLTAPLVTKSDGGKFGKTESGAIWLTPDRTSPYAFYQFWLNADDADAGRFLRLFTLLPREEIEPLEREHAKDPSKRLAQRALAREATDLVHGRTDRESAEKAAAALFSGHTDDLPEAALAEIMQSAPTTTHDKSLLAGEGLKALDLIALTSLVTSKSEARQLLSTNSFTLNNRKLEAADRVTTDRLMNGVLAVRKGKKHWHILKFQ
jgi:tyrosyl-tRNA synthetase